MTTTVQRLSQLNFASLSPAGGLFPSPIAWEDQARSISYTIFLYLRHNECRLGKHSSVDVCHGFRNLVLMLDRFSDGRENGYKDNEGNLVRSGTTPPYSAAGAENAVKTEWESSFGNCSGGGFCDF